jgi:hypothetical protein
VEQSVERMKIYIQGVDVGVETGEISTGTRINKTIKQGVEKASKEYPWNMGPCPPNRFCS